MVVSGSETTRQIWASLTRVLAPGVCTLLYCSSTYYSCIPFSTPSIIPDDVPASSPVHWPILRLAYSIFIPATSHLTSALLIPCSSLRCIACVHRQIETHFSCLDFEGSLSGIKYTNLQGLGIVAVCGVTSILLSEQRLGRLLMPSLGIRGSGHGRNFIFLECKIGGLSCLLAGELQKRPPPSPSPSRTSSISFLPPRTSEVMQWATRWHLSV